MKLTRLRADLLLLLTAIIWGTAFVAQKTGMDGIGPFGFVAVRFVLSFFAVAPFAWLEIRNKKPLSSIGIWPVVTLCTVFTAGVIFQQYGVAFTSVTNAGFITGLYVVITPLIAWPLLQRRPAGFVWLAGLIAVAGFWFINGGSLASVQIGDGLVLLCAVAFAIHVALTGYIMQKTGMPLTYAVIQYAVCAAVALPCAVVFEGLKLQGLQDNAFQIIYAGLVSGGIAYTMQLVAQQHTPPGEAAIILSGEALFAALAGAVILSDRLTPMGWAGCGLIIAAILLVEVGPLLRNRFWR